MLLERLLASNRPHDFHGFGVLLVEKLGPGTYAGQ